MHLRGEKRESKMNISSKGKKSKAHLFKFYSSLAVDKIGLACWAASEGGTKMDGEPLFELGVEGESVTEEILLEQDSPSDLNVPLWPLVTNAEWLLELPRVSRLLHRGRPKMKCDPSKSISCSFWCVLKSSSLTVFKLQIEQVNTTTPSDSSGCLFLKCCLNVDDCKGIIRKKGRKKKPTER